jgi:transcriptional regulator with XRE-family HTH domain
MAKAQHASDYRAVPAALRGLREAAGLTQRELGLKLRRPQSWVYNCETANRRVDVAEFARWCRACGADPVRAFRQVVEAAG